MLTPGSLLRKEVCYDIVVSDFGRDATLEYLRLMATREKAIISSVLEPSGLDFFDEYRRLMFTVIGDIAFFKKKAIEAAGAAGFLTTEILIGVGSVQASEDCTNRVALCVAQEVEVALARGYRKLRAAIPCNTLSGMARQVEQVVCSAEKLRELRAAYDIPIGDCESVGRAGLVVHTVPEAVARFLTKGESAPQNIDLLVLGTRGANALYRNALDRDRVCVLPLSSREYDAIGRAVVASIDGSPRSVAIARELLSVELVEPRRASSPHLVVVEACTDFRLDLGLSSLELFANAMVDECYGL